MLYRSIFAQGIKNFYRLIDQASESHEAIVIAGKRSNVVSISEKLDRYSRNALFAFNSRTR